METNLSGITSNYLVRAEVCLLITTLAYVLMNGAQIFETAVLVPKWTANPPASLSMLQGQYAPDLKTFWIVTHSIHEITFIAAIILCWKIPEARVALLVLFGIHFGIRVWTLGYFAPKIIAFQQGNFTPVAAELEVAVSQWRNLNYVRVGMFVVVSMGVAFVYIKVKGINATKQITQTIINNTMMEQRLTVVTLGVDNLAAQTEFYKTKLGWKAVAENKDIVFFKLNGFLFSLLDRKTLATGSGVNEKGSGFRSFTLSYNVNAKEEVNELHLEFERNGIKIVKGPTDTPFGGYYFIFTDPENNVLEVAYNPYIPLDSEGNVVTHKNIDNL